MNLSALLTFGILLFSATAGAEPKYISLSAEFDKFIFEGANADFETQLSSWINNVESKLPEVYLHILAGDKPADLDANRRKAAIRAFPFIFSHAKEIHEQFATFETDGIAAIKKLVKKYPEADMSQVTVIGMPSLDSFNGQVTEVHGKVFALFGMDMVAHINAQPDFIPGAILLNNLPILMTHEFSHALHGVLSDFSTSDNTTASFWGPAWEEGLAQVNSQLLVPGTSLTYVYMEKIIAEKCTPENIAIWSNLYLQDAKGNEDEIILAYDKWFKMKPIAIQQFGVYRAGYCLGYNVILTALRQYSMIEILTLPRLDAYRVVREALTDMAAPANNSRSF